MRTWVCLLLSLWLAACAGTMPPSPRPDHLLHDQRFAAPSERIDPADVFALSDAMKRYLYHDIARVLHTKGLQQGLVDALYRADLLRLDYDAAKTRNAAQAFDARAGNCLSLVIMTVAFAKELQLRVEFQSAFLEETWSRSGNLYLRSGHVNLTLGRRFVDSGTLKDSASLTIDFLPAEELRGLRTRTISEQTVIAMYMNNRAAEALLAGRLDDAYWWAREALRQSPAFLSAYNTLGVVYLRHGDLAPAEAVLAHVLAQEPDNTRAMSNLSLVLTAQGRATEANALNVRLAQLEPHPPFAFFDLGVAAMQRGDFQAARDWFAKEVARAEYHAEFHFWLGLASYQLGDVRQAQKHLALAIENSTSRGDHDLYAAKLAWLKSHSQH